MMDLGLLIIRVVVGGLLLGHGLQKLIGWFGGHGLAGTEGFVAQLGYPMPKLMTRALALGEVAGGAALAFGFGTPIAAAVIIAVMVNAIIAVHAAHGPWAQDGGYEFPLTLLAATAGIALAGPGAFSLDAMLLESAWSQSWSVGGVLTGIVLGASALTARAMHRRRSNRVSVRRGPVAA